LQILWHTASASLKKFRVGQSPARKSSQGDTTDMFRKIILMITAAMLSNLFLCCLAAGEVKRLKGQTIYVPSYSNIISESYRVVLRANLIVHNTDPTQSITLIRIDRYDTNGKLVEKYLAQPLELGPLAATRLTIKKLEQGDEGAGANFLVQWRAQELVTEPIIESIMVGSLGTQGHSFSSQGRVIHED
jgi:hypothetical protein